MKLAVIGVGNAGSRVANRILHEEKRTGRDLTSGNSLLINDDRPTFDKKARVPEDRRLEVGDIHREETGHGIDGDPDLAVEIARDEINEIRRAFDAIEFRQVDGVMVTAGLAGGTGGGVGAVVLDELQAIVEKPVYALGVLPREPEGPEPAMNAARSVQSFVAKADNVIAFDNEAWVTPEEAAADDYGRVNGVLATRIVTLFAAGEVDSPSAAETRMDPSDLMRTLDTGGITSIGHASTDVATGRHGVLSWLWRLPWPIGFPWWGAGEEEPTDAARINRVVRKAARSKLTLPCEISSAERALIMLSGPSWALSRKGFESGQYWLEQEADTAEVMAGDDPHDDASELTATVLLSNVTEVPRIDAMQRQAVAKPKPLTDPADAVEGPATD